MHLFHVWPSEQANILFGQSCPGISQISAVWEALLSVEVVVHE